MSKLACCSQTPHSLLDTNACMIGSYVSLAEYLCTYSCLLYLCFADETSVSLVVSRGLRRLAWYLSYDLVPSAGSGR